MHVDKSERKFGLAAATSIGVGGMIGAGIFSLLGIASAKTGTHTYLAFLIAGVLAYFCAYSFGKLGARFPSSGGPVEYLVQGMGENTYTATLNFLLWLGYIVVNALYARAFGEYGVALLSLDAYREFGVPLIAVGVILAFMVINRRGSHSVGVLQIVLVLIQTVLLLLFALWINGDIWQSSETVDLWPDKGATWLSVFFYAGLVFMTYEGFGLITNAAEDLRKPEINLPRSLTFAVLIVISVYVLVALAVNYALSPTEIEEAKAYALAEAARPFFGRIGFSIMAIAALFSTGSAINATLYGASNVGNAMSRKGQLPSSFRKRLWGVPEASLLYTSLLVILIAVTLPMEKIAMAGSLSFLVIYGAVNAAHLKLLSQTRAHALYVWTGLFGCVAGALTLTWYIWQESPEIFMIFLGFVGFGIVTAWLMQRVNSNDAEQGP